MSNSVSDDLQLFAQEIKSLLSPNTLQNLARDVGFGVLPHRQTLIDKFVLLFLILLSNRLW